MRGVGALVALGLLMLATAPAYAQRTTATLGAGFVSVRYADTPGISLATLTPSLTRTSGRSLLGLGGTYSAGPSGVWSAQGMLTGALFTPVSRAGWLGEVGGTFGGSVHADGARTGQMLGTGRVHRLGRVLGGWLGGGVGAMWNGAEWGGVQQGELGFSARGERLSLLAILTPTRALDSLRFADARGVLTFAVGAVEYRASLGARLGDSLPIAARDQRVWGDLGITAWLAPRTALVASAGTYPVDPAQGFPSGRFLALSLRVGGRRPAMSPSSEGGIDDRARADARRAGVQAFDVRRLDADRVRLRVRADGASTVELMGDLTAWQPITMRRGEGAWWVLDLAASAGVHEITVRRDGGGWVVPPGLRVSTDEFGGRSGLLLVP
jgi:hypothetical protein